MKLTIPQVCISSTKCRRIPYSLNKRLHWAERYKWAKAWKEAVWGEVLANRKALGRLPYKKALVVITYYTLKYLDTDNAYTAAKPLIDGLTEAGVIVDDNPEVLELQVKQNKVTTRAGERVSIDVYDATRGNPQKPSAGHYTVC